MDCSLNDKLSKLDLVIFDLDGTLIDSNGTNNYLDIKLVHSIGDKKVQKKSYKKEMNLLRII